MERYGGNATLGTHRDDMRSRVCIAHQLLACESASKRALPRHDRNALHSVSMTRESLHPVRKKAALKPRAMLVFVVTLSLAGCAGVRAERAASPHPETLVIPDDVANPKRIRFEVRAAFPASTPEIEASHFSPNKKVALAWRRYAETELRNRGLCQYGFAGPEVTFWRKSKNETWFDVECLQGPR